MFVITKETEVVARTMDSIEAWRIFFLRLSFGENVTMTKNGKEC